MTNDLSTLAAAPATLTVAGESFAIHPLTLADFGGLQAWVDARHPDPLDIAHRAIESGKFTVAQQQFLLRTALEQASKPKVLIGTPEADAMLRSMDGVVALLVLSIRKGRPGFTDADARRLYERMTFADVARVLESTTANMVMTTEAPDDPKAAGAETEMSAGTMT